MKRIILIAFAAFIVSAGLMGQKMNAIKTDLFSPFLRTGVLKYERAINENFSLQLGAFYTGYSPRGTDARLSGYGITPEFRFYLSEKPAPHGTYLAPNVRYMMLEAKDTNTEEFAKMTAFGIAFNIGHQMVLKDIVVLDGWIGPSYNFRNVSEVVGDIDFGIQTANGFGIRLGVAIGIVF